MLVLSRRVNESITIDGGIEITIIAVNGNRVKLGIEAPDSVQILRSELVPPDLTWTDSEAAVNPGRLNEPDDPTVQFAT